MASEKFRLYTTFNQAELQKLLLLVQESAVALLAAGETDPLGYGKPPASLNK